MTGLKLEEVTSFKYLEATLCKDGTCSAENCIRLASAMARLNRIQDLAKQHHQLRKQVQVKYKSLVTHILLSGCETWTLLADSEKMIQAFKTDQVPEETSPHPLPGAQNEQLGAEQDQHLCGSTGTSSGNCQETKFAWFGHVTPRGSFSKTALQGTLESERRRGRHRKCWMDNIKESTSFPMPELLTRTSCKKDCKRVSAESSVVSLR